ncbi:MAG: imidazole glycerol phosphate synthase subunit HisH, partial [Chloroflexi bacterium]|nr:imidazole glycerol phosphate synthase subunit HisH [Chloroflexota bacterium]
MLTIVDYGVGNLRSVYMAFKRLGCEAHIATEPSELKQATALVLPGVGAFGDAMASLDTLGFKRPLYDVLRSGIPFLGICLGMQLLFEGSDEQGEYRGLGILSGRVRRFAPGLVVPQMGWNQVRQVRPSPLWQAVPDASYVYFVHSYYAQPENESDVIGSTDYGGEYACAVARDNVYAIQFHPEKSQNVGETILR